VRELDVALSNWRGAASYRKKYSQGGDKLSAFLHKERAEELLKAAPLFDLQKFTPFLLTFMEWVLSEPLRENKAEILIDKAAGKKLGRWYKNMAEIAGRYPDFSNDDEAHALRIKAKCARYVMQSMSGRAYGDDNQVMRSLKRLLDALGLLHDNRVNENIAKRAVKKGAGLDLAYQAGIFVGGERAQSLRLRKLLPPLWEKFAEDWARWYRAFKN
jgi:CHAD domain-containing protein